MNKMKSIFLFVLLIIIIILFVYSFFKPLAEDNEAKLDHPTIKKKQIIVPSRIESTVDNQELEKKPLLGIQKNKQTQQAEKELPPKLDLQVQGIFLGKKENSGYALIAYNGTPKQVYIVGATLSEGVILKSLSANEVIIDNHGRLEKYPAIVSKKAENPPKSSLRSESELRQPKVVNNAPPMNDLIPPPPPKEPLENTVPPPPNDGAWPK